MAARAAFSRPLALVITPAGAEEPPREPGQGDDRPDRRDEEEDAHAGAVTTDQHVAIVGGSRPVVSKRGGVATRDEVMEILRTVEDPELGMDIVDLGLLYDVEVDNSTAKVTYSLTSMGCPAGPLVAQDIDSAIRQVEGIQDVQLELTFDPPWTPDRMSDDAKFILGFG